MGPGCAHLLSIHQAHRPPALRWLRADRCSTLAKEESTDSPGCPEQSWVWDGFPSHGWETAWRPGLGWGWPGAPRLSGNAGAPHFVVTAVPLCMVSEEAVVATTPGPGRPCLLPTPGRVVSALRHPYLRETRIQFTGNKSTEKKKVAFGSAIESSPLTWSVRSPVTPHRKPCLQGPPPGHSCLLSQRPIPQGVLEPTGHSREEGWLGLALPALVPSLGSWAHTRMGPRARGSASPHAPQQAGKGKQQREAMVLGGLAGSMGAATGSTVGEGHRPWQALPFLGWPPHP